MLYFENLYDLMTVDNIFYCSVLGIIIVGSCKLQMKQEKLFLESGESHSKLVNRVTL